MCLSTESKSTSKKYMQKAVKSDFLRIIYFSFMLPLLYVGTEYLSHKQNANKVIKNKCFQKVF